MKKDWSHLEPYRIRGGTYATTTGCPFGVFKLPKGNGGVINVIVDNGKETGWEHVSVTVIDRKKNAPDRCPRWDEMQRVKELFWEDAETVVQFHPAEDNRVNVHEFCLHLWRRCGGEYVLPPEFMV